MTAMKKTHVLLPWLYVVIGTFLASSASAAIDGQVDPEYSLLPDLPTCAVLQYYDVTLKSCVKAEPCSHNDQCKDTEECRTKMCQPSTCTATAQCVNPLFVCAPQGYCVENQTHIAHIGGTFTMPSKVKCSDWYKGSKRILMTLNDGIVRYYNDWCAGGEKTCAHTNKGYLNNDGQLVIRSVLIQDKGYYFCTPQDSAEKSPSGFQLTVQSNLTGDDVKFTVLNETDTRLFVKLEVLNTTPIAYMRCAQGTVVMNMSERQNPDNITANVYSVFMFDIPRGTHELQVECRIRRLYGEEKVFTRVFQIHAGAAGGGKNNGSDCAGASTNGGSVSGVIIGVLAFLLLVSLLIIVVFFTDQFKYDGLHMNRLKRRFRRTYQRTSSSPENYEANRPA